MNAPSDRDGITITDLAQAHSALLLIKAGIDQGAGQSATLDLMRAVSEYLYELPATPAHTRPADPDNEDALLRIATPQQAQSAALLIEAGLETAASLPGVLDATGRVTAALIGYIEAINPAADPDPGPA